MKKFVAFEKTKTTLSLVTETVWIIAFRNTNKLRLISYRCKPIQVRDIHAQHIHTPLETIFPHYLVDACKLAIRFLKRDIEDNIIHDFNPLPTIENVQNEEYSEYVNWTYFQNSLLDPVPSTLSLLENTQPWPLILSSQHEPKRLEAILTIRRLCRRLNCRFETMGLAICLLDISKNYSPPFTAASLWLAAKAQDFGPELAISDVLDAGSYMLHVTPQHVLESEASIMKVGNSLLFAPRLFDTLELYIRTYGPQGGIEPPSLFIMNQQTRRLEHYDSYAQILVCGRYFLETSLLHSASLQIPHTLLVLTCFLLAQAVILHIPLQHAHCIRIDCSLPPLDADPVLCMRVASWALEASKKQNPVFMDYLPYSTTWTSAVVQNVMDSIQ